MYGAIIGDIVGSRFEFDRGGKTKKFTFFTKEDTFTDDTVMTIAVADGLLHAGGGASAEEIHKAVISAMQAWGKRYPNAGYGGRFSRWLFSSSTPKPYGSYGNGSAMRVSAAGWLYDSLERTRFAAKATSEVTHNHPEGVKGAECTAAVIFMGRTGTPKEQIRQYVIQEFGYDLSESLNQMRVRHTHVETCQDSMPKALQAFFEGDCFEDVIRNAVSLGGDTDTLAAIAGAMAEAFYGIPVTLIAEADSYLPEEMKQIIHAFLVAVGRSTDPFNHYENNQFLKLSIRQLFAESTHEAFLSVLDVLLKLLMINGEAPTPMVDANDLVKSMDIGSICAGDIITLNQELRLTFDTMQDGDGNLWFPLFTDEDELSRGQTANVQINAPISVILENGRKSDRVQGVVINPFGEAFTLSKEIIGIVLDRYTALEKGANE